MRHKPLLCLFLVMFVGLFLFSVWVHADDGLTVGLYSKFKDSKDGFINTYVFAVGEAFLTANAVLENRGQPPLYCQPPKLALTGGGYKAILDSFLEEQKSSPIPEDTAIELALLKALQRAFPCNR